jgi:3-oxoacyl-[acyl-carrier protein] reductase
MPISDQNLTGRTALVTGVSRRKGIGYAVARELADLGASVFTHHYAPHDADTPWGADDLDAVSSGVRDALRGDAVAGSTGADLTDPSQIDDLFDAARALTGSVDVLVCNHARAGGDGSIFDMSPSALDTFWETNTRSTILLTRRFALQFLEAAPDVATRPGERLVRTAPSDPWKAATPFGRWGEPTDPARLIGWLAGPAGSWVVGQVLTTDGGFGLQ